MAILRHAEIQAQEKISRLSLGLQDYHTRNLDLEKALRDSNDAIARIKEDNKKLTSKVQDLEAKLDTSRKNAWRNAFKLMKTKAQVNTLLEEKQRKSDERAAVAQTISELEAACQRFRRRAV